MPVRYIGRDPFQKAKSLYEMCRQLRDFGVGRIVYQKNLSEKWPSQKSYFKLTKVIPDLTHEEFFKGTAWGVEVFRGKLKGESQITTGHKRDWVMVPKDEEAAFCVITEQYDVNDIPLPTQIDCPPLLDIILKRELKVTGKTDTEKIQIPFIPDRVIQELDSEWA